MAIILQAHDSHSRIGTREIVRIGSLPSQPDPRPRPIKVCFNSTHEAQLFLCRSERALRAFPDLRLAFRAELRPSERIDRLIRRAKLQRPEGSETQPTNSPPQATAAERSEYRTQQIDCLQTIISTIPDISHAQPLLLLSSSPLPMTAPSPEA